ncbi:Fic/DOC family protein [Mycolicibacterium goodii]|uniref:protein adenylyltransferase n=1 Tax=Mycolicibacterium goodii TaxID=134601 RepID=A0A0K0XCQ6_MYCGD|nr:cell filamentation protein Fic [Mycolicibacterium goodii]
MVAELRIDERHALAQTIAAERLEGWQPDDGEISGLGELLTGTVTFGEYLAAHLPSRSPHPRRRPLFSRHRPYFAAGSTVLRNSFGIADAATLARVEFVATAGRILQAHLQPDVHELDVCRLHQHVFGDVYPWAGQVRIVELRRGDQAFGSCTQIPRRLSEVHADVAALAGDGHALDDGALSFRLARIYAEYNAIHPFREGNGRTGTLLLHLLARRAGRRLHLDAITRDDWITASRDSTPFRRDGRADPRPFVAVLQRCLGQGFGGRGFGSVR